MPSDVPLPGRSRPTEREARRWQLGRSEDWRFPEKRIERGLDRPGLVLCPRCHAISEQKRWYYDERRFEQLGQRPDAQFIVCDGCMRIERQMYGGEVLLRSPLLIANKEQAKHLIYHTEEQAKTNNPLARLASVDDHGEEIAVLTTTAWLAVRIGKEFKKAFGGNVQVQRLPQEKFARVRWLRES
jgi:hypothetical protein